MSALHRPRLARCVPALAFVLLFCSTPLKASESPPDTGASRPFMASYAAVTAGLQEAASMLKQSIASIRSRSVEAREALVLIQKAITDLEAETIAIKALLVLKQFPLERVEEVYAAYTARASKMASSQKRLEEDIARLRQDTSSKLEAIDGIEKDLMMISASREPDDARKELEAAFDGFRRMVASEERETARLLEIYEKTGEFFQKEKALVDDILPMLEKQRESWKQELLERQEHRSFRQQLLEIWSSVTAVPGRLHQWTADLARSGKVQAFAVGRPMTLLGLIALVAALSWGAWRLKRLAGMKLEIWKSQGVHPLARWGVAVAREVVAQVYSIGLTLWLALTLKTIGISHTAPSSLALAALVTLIVLSLSLRLIRVSYEVAIHEESRLLTDGAARFYRRQIRLFVVWGLLGGFVLFSLPLLGFPMSIRQLVRLLHAAGLLYFVIRMTRPPRMESLLSALPAMRQRSRRWAVLSGRLRYGLISLLAVALVAYPLGFQPLALYLAGSAGLSVALIVAWLVAIFVCRAVVRFLLHAEDGRIGRTFPEHSEMLDGLYLLAQRSLDGLLTAGAVVGLFHVWGVAPQSLLTALTWLQYRIPIGAAHVSPLNILLGALVLYLGFWLSRFTTRVLQTRVFPQTGWDIGIQYTISTILEYVILILGILMALNVLGFPLGNLALIMGALGVGIGLGLQNIVSNFFSGLVLLIERPIKVGDMLVIDGQWGEVKQIRIRSTVFETFEKSVMIIPNSELTASKILNWTHYGRGSNRITLKIGVAYDSDIALVTRLLKEVCASNERVLHEPAPQVLFVAYGESSLDFSIMVHVLAPEHRMPATHELNSAIFDVLREHHIEIPFPQRDLTIKNWPRSFLKEES